MTAIENLKQEDILCVNGEFYIFLTSAKYPVTLYIDCDRKFQIGSGTKDDLRKAAKEKEGEGLGLVLFARNNNQCIEVGDYTLTPKTKTQIQLGINAPKNMTIIREGIKKELVLN